MLPMAADAGPSPDQGTSDTQDDGLREIPADRVHTLVHPPERVAVRDLRSARTHVGGVVPPRATVQIGIEVHVPNGHAYQMANAQLAADAVVRHIIMSFLVDDESDDDTSVLLPPELGGVEFTAMQPTESFRLLGRLYGAAKRKANEDPLGFLANVAQVSGLSAAAVLAPLVLRPVDAQQPAPPPAAIVEIRGTSPNDAMPSVARMVAPAGTDITYTVTVSSADAPPRTVSVRVHYR
jgi:hypothetical protein